MPRIAKRAAAKAAAESSSSSSSRSRGSHKDSDSSSLRANPTTEGREDHEDEGQDETREKTNKTNKERNRRGYIPAGFHWLRLAFGRGHWTWHQDLAAGPRTHRHTHPSAHAPVSTRIPASGAHSLSVSSQVSIKALEQACHSADEHDITDLIIAPNQNNVRHFGLDELAIRTILNRSASFAMRHEPPP